MSFLVQESVRSEIKTDDEGGFATCYGMDGAELESRQEQEIVSCSEPSGSALTPTQSTI
jgi:hypothetical protein